MSVHAMVYTADGPEQYDDIDAALSTDGETWVHASGVESTEMDLLADRFDIHQLAIEDILDDQTRSKTE